MKRIVAVALAFLALNASATAFTTDWTDLWFNPSEPGWGLTVYQQNDTLFATLFVYSANGTPTWYTASSMSFVSSSGSVFTFSGPLYTTQGTNFAAPWNQGAFGLRQVGNLSLSFNTIIQGSMTYTVDGAQVNKAITRNTFKANTLVGDYIGAAIGTYSGCPVNGYQEEPGVITVSQSGGTTTIRVQYSAGGTCTYAGALQQAGRFNIIDGTLACSNGGTGTFSAFELAANISGLTGRAQASLGGSCRWSGRVGGLRRGT